METHKKRLLLLLVEGLVLLLIGWQVYAGMHPVPTLEHVRKNFGISVTTEQANRLYEKNTQGWFGDGEIYSVWQYDDGAVLETLLPWQQGNGFQQQLYQQVVKANEPDAYYQPRALGQDVFYYLQDHDADGHGDDQILFIYTPQITLGDGLQYKNLLFVLEWYS